MEVFAEGFAPKEVDFAIVEKNPTVLNITLRHVSILYYLAVYTYFFRCSGIYIKSTTQGDLLVFVEYFLLLVH